MAAKAAARATACSTISGPALGNFFVKYLKAHRSRHPVATHRCACEKSMVHPELSGKCGLSFPRTNDLETKCQPSPDYLKMEHPVPCAPDLHGRRHSQWENEQPYRRSPQHCLKKDHRAKQGPTESRRPLLQPYLVASVAPRLIRRRALYTIDSIIVNAKHECCILT